MWWCSRLLWLKNSASWYAMVELPSPVSVQYDYIYSCYTTIDNTLCNDYGFYMQLLIRYISLLPYLCTMRTDWWASVPAASTFTLTVGRQIYVICTFCKHSLSFVVTALTSCTGQGFSHTVSFTVPFVFPHRLHKLVIAPSCLLPNYPCMLYFLLPWNGNAAIEPCNCFLLLKWNGYIVYLDLLFSLYMYCMSCTTCPTINARINPITYPCNVMITLQKIIYLLQPGSKTTKRTSHSSRSMARWITAFETPVFASSVVQ